jgi:F-type H+-transporting ATPase subunit gamma
MSNLRELKKKITTIDKIKKIFLVMKAIASSKMKKAQNDVNLSNKAIDLIKEMFLSSVRKSSDPSKILSELNLGGLDQRSPVLYLLISSDKGLCGNYNNLVLRKMNSIFKEIHQEKNDYRIMFAGKKVKNILSSKIDAQKIIQDFSDLKFNDFINDFEKISLLSEKIFSLFYEGQISDCKIIYVFSENIMSRKIRVESLFDLKSDKFFSLKNIIFSRNTNDCLGFQNEGEDNLGNENKSNVIFEPNEIDVIKNIKNSYFRAKFFNFFRNAYFSELASRMIAMDNASRNSSEIVKKMTLKYNKKRQENITKELIDIVNGSENI